jgi:hypothetical protein
MLLPSGARRAAWAQRARPLDVDREPMMKEMPSRLRWRCWPAICGVGDLALAARRGPRSVGLAERLAASERQSG